MAVILVVFD